VHVATITMYICTVAEPSKNMNVMIERLDKEYIEIEQFVFKAIKRRKVPLKDVLDWIRFPPMTLWNQFAELVQAQTKLLANVSSIDELYFIISSYLNSFHPDLLVYLINQLEDTDLKVRMDHLVTTWRTYITFASRPLWVTSWTTGLVIIRSHLATRSTYNSNLH
jgi:hypothetical protein